MFCQNCGKEIPNNTRFCNHCGSPQKNGFTQNEQSNYQNNGQQYANANSQPVHTAPHSGKSKRKGPRRVIIGIVVAAAAFVIGYYATGANKLEVPTPFDPPTVHDPIVLPSPSIKQDTTDESVITSGIQCKTFSLESDIAHAYTKFFYGDDGIVESVSGNITVDDTTMVDAKYLEDLKADVEVAKNLLVEMGVDDTSYVTLIDDTANHKFFENYLFTLRDANSAVAELAATFIGFEAEDGRITIDQAETAMLSFGFSLQ